jgi:RND family efflux transporter MFP subunit
LLKSILDSFESFFHGGSTTDGLGHRRYPLADVPEQELPRVKKDASVEIEVTAYAGRTFSGKVDWISGVLDPATRTAKVRCAVANPEGFLKPEMYATVDKAASGRGAVAVPRQALMRFGDHTVVFVQTEGEAGGRARFERRPVVVDEAETGAYVPIERGLARGDLVVIEGLRIWPA